MPIESQTILNRIDELLAYSSVEKSHLNAATRQMLYQGTLNLLQLVYGENSTQLNEFKLISERHWKSFHVYPSGFDNSMEIESAIYGATIGVLSNLRAEIVQGLISNIRQEAVREVYADFIIMARKAIEDNNKDVAAVLASAALEDSFKKSCAIKGIDVADKEMADVIGIMKAKGILSGTQAKLAPTYNRLRNFAMHAQWDQIHLPEVQSMIGFTESFIIANAS
jgi:hypothetical protein